MPRPRPQPPLRRRPSRRRLGAAAPVALVLAVVASVLLASPAPPAAAFAGSPWFEPGKVYTQDFPDPTVVYDGGTYYAYSTNTGGQYLPVMTSTDLVTWTARPAYNAPACALGAGPYFNDALACPPTWARRTIFDHPHLVTGIYSPGVIRNGAGWLAYYTVDVAPGRQCISVATAPSPLGPFVDTSSGPLQCDVDPGGSIDPTPYRDGGGNLWLVWKSEGIVGSTPTRIWSRALTAAGTSFAPGSGPNELLRTAVPWEGNVIENPSMVAWAGRLWLFYSGNEWASASYGMGAATCASPAGPCTRTSSSPLLHSFGGQWGPGGGAGFVDGAGRLRLAYHWWNAPYTSYPAYPACATAGTCATQGQRRLGITGVELLPDGTLTLEPIGALESVAGGVEQLAVTGWAIDPDSDAPVPVRLTVDGVASVVYASAPRPDVAAAHGGFSAAHGLAATVPVAAGQHTVCATAINLGVGWSDHFLGCAVATATDPPPPTLPTGPAPAPPAAAGFHSVTPARIFDSRDGTGGFTGPVRAGWTVPVVAAGRGGVPASGASAVAVNVTVTGATAPGFVTLYPCGDPKPEASNVNYATGQTVAAGVIARVGAGGAVCAYSNARTQLIVDVVGWFDTDASGARLTSLVPSRVVDTRSGVGTTAGAIGPGATRTVDLTGVGGVPASGVTAVVANITVTGTTSASHLTLWPNGGSRPGVSNLNWGPGTTVANLATVPVAADGTVSIFNNAGDVQVIVDVVGWYGAGGAGAYHPATPVRVVDTRDGTGTGTGAGPLSGGSTASYVLAGRGPVPASGATAVVATVTVTGTTSASHLTVWPAGATKPDASSLNWAAGQTVPNLVVVPLSADGRISVFDNAGQAHVIVDVVGWFG